MEEQWGLREKISCPEMGTSLLGLGCGFEATQAGAVWVRVCCFCCYPPVVVASCCVQCGARELEGLFCVPTPRLAFGALHTYTAEGSLSAPWPLTQHWTAVACTQCKLVWGKGVFILLVQP